MSRQRDIEATLQRIRSEGPSESTNWHKAYNEDVTYLVNVLRGYGPPLRRKLQQSSIEIDRRDRALRRAKRVSIASLGMLSLVFVGLGFFVLSSESLSLFADRDRGPSTAAVASAEDPGAAAPKRVRHSVEAGTVPSDDEDESTLRFTLRPDGRFCSDWFPAVDSSGCDGRCQWQRVCTRDACDPERAGQCPLELPESHCGPWPGSCPVEIQLDDTSMIKWSITHGFEWDFKARVWRRVPDGLSLQEALDIDAGIVATSED